MAAHLVWLLYRTVSGTTDQDDQSHGDHSTDRTDTHHGVASQSNRGALANDSCDDQLRKDEHLNDQLVDSDHDIARPDCTGHNIDGEWNPNYGGDQHLFDSDAVSNIGAHKLNLDEPINQITTGANCNVIPDSLGESSVILDSNASTLIKSTDTSVLSACGKLKSHCLKNSCDNSTYPEYECSHACSDLKQSINSSKCEKCVKHSECEQCMKQSEHGQSSTKYSEFENFERQFKCGKSLLHYEQEQSTEQNECEHDQSLICSEYDHSVKDNDREKSIPDRESSESSQFINQPNASICETVKNQRHVNSNGNNVIHKAPNTPQPHFQSNKETTDDYIGDLDTLFELETHASGDQDSQTDEGFLDTDSITSDDVIRARADSMTMGLDDTSKYGLGVESGSELPGGNDTASGLLSVEGFASAPYVSEDSALDTKVISDSASQPHDHSEFKPVTFDEKTDCTDEETRTLCGSDESDQHSEAGDLDNKHAFLEEDLFCKFVCVRHAEPEHLDKNKDIISDIEKCDNPHGGFESDDTSIACINTTADSDIKCNGLEITQRSQHKHHTMPPHAEHSLNQHIDISVDAPVNHFVVEASDNKTTCSHHKDNDQHIVQHSMPCYESMDDSEGHLNRRPCENVDTGASGSGAAVVYEDSLRDDVLKTMHNAVNYYGVYQPIDEFDAALAGDTSGNRDTTLERIENDVCAALQHNDESCVEQKTLNDVGSDLGGNDTISSDNGMLSRADDRPINGNLSPDRYGVRRKNRTKENCDGFVEDNNCDDSLQHGDDHDQALQTLCAKGALDHDDDHPNAEDGMKSAKQLIQAFSKARDGTICPKKSNAKCQTKSQCAKSEQISEDTGADKARSVKNIKHLIKAFNQARDGSIDEVLVHEPDHQIEMENNNGPCLEEGDNMHDTRKSHEFVHENHTNELHVIAIYEGRQANDIAPVQGPSDTYFNPANVENTHTNIMNEKEVFKASSSIHFTLKGDETMDTTLPGQTKADDADKEPQSSDSDIDHIYLVNMSDSLEQDSELNELLISRTCSDEVDVDVDQDPKEVRADDTDHSIQTASDSHTVYSHKKPPPPPLYPKPRYVPGIPTERGECKRQSQRHVPQGLENTYYTNTSIGDRHEHSRTESNAIDCFLVRPGSVEHLDHDSSDFAKELVDVNEHTQDMVTTDLTERDGSYTRDEGRLGKCAASSPAVNCTEPGVDSTGDDSLKGKDQDDLGASFDNKDNASSTIPQSAYTSSDSCKEDISCSWKTGYCNETNEYTPNMYVCNAKHDNIDTHVTSDLDTGLMLCDFEYYKSITPTVYVRTRYGNGDQDTENSTDCNVYEYDIDVCFDEGTGDAILMDGSPIIIDSPCKEGRVGVDSILNDEFSTNESMEPGIDEGLRSFLKDDEVNTIGFTIEDTENSDKVDTRKMDVQHEELTQKHCSLETEAIQISSCEAAGNSSPNCQTTVQNDDTYHTTNCLAAKETTMQNGKICICHGSNQDNRDAVGVEMVNGSDVTILYDNFEETGCTSPKLESSIECMQPYIEKDPEKCSEGMLTIRDQDSEGMSLIIDQDFEGKSHIADKDSEDIIYQDSESMSSIIDQHSEGMPPILDQDVEDMTRIVDEDSEGISPIVNQHAEYMSPIGDQDSDGLSNIVDKGSEDILPIIDQDSESISSIIDQHCEGMSPDLDPEGMPRIVDQESEGISPIIDQDSETMSPIIDQDSEGISPIIDQDCEGTLPITDKDSKGKSPIFDQDSEGVSPVVDQDSESLSSLIDKDSESKSPFTEQYSEGISHIIDQDYEGILQNIDQPSDGTSHSLAQDSESRLPTIEKDSNDMSTGIEPDSKVITDIIEQDSKDISSIINTDAETKLHINGRDSEVTSHIAGKESESKSRFIEKETKAMQPLTESDCESVLPIKEKQSGTVMPSCSYIKTKKPLHHLQTENLLKGDETKGNVKIHNKVEQNKEITIKDDLSWIADESSDEIALADIDILPKQTCNTDTRERIAGHKSEHLVDGKCSSCVDEIPPDHVTDDVIHTNDKSRDKARDFPPATNLGDSAKDTHAQVECFNRRGSQSNDAIAHERLGLDRCQSEPVDIVTDRWKVDGNYEDIYDTFLRKKAVTAKKLQGENQARDSNNMPVTQQKKVDFGIRTQIVCFKGQYYVETVPDYSTYTERNLTLDNPSDLPERKPLRFEPSNSDFYTRPRSPDSDDSIEPLMYVCLMSLDHGLLSLLVSDSNSVNPDLLSDDILYESSGEACHINNLVGELVIEPVPLCVATQHQACFYTSGELCSEITAVYQPSTIAVECIDEKAVPPTSTEITTHSSASNHNVLGASREKSDPPIESATFEKCESGSEGLAFEDVGKNASLPGEKLAENEGIGKISSAATEKHDILTGESVLVGAAAAAAKCDSDSQGIEKCDQQVELEVKILASSADKNAGLIVLTSVSEEKNAGFIATGGKANEQAAAPGALLSSGHLTTKIAATAESAGEANDFLSSDVINTPGKPSSVELRFEEVEDGLQTAFSPVQRREGVAGHEIQQQREGAESCSVLTGQQDKGQSRERDFEVTSGLDSSRISASSYSGDCCVHGKMAGAKKDTFVVSFNSDTSSDDDSSDTDSVVAMPVKKVASSKPAGGDKGSDSTRVGKTPTGGSDGGGHLQNGDTLADDNKEKNASNEKTGVKSNKKATAKEETSDDKGDGKKKKKKVTEEKDDATLKKKKKKGEDGEGAKEGKKKKDDESEPVKEKKKKKKEDVTKESEETPAKKEKKKKKTDTETSKDDTEQQGEKKKKKKKVDDKKEDKAPDKEVEEKQLVKEKELAAQKSDKNDAPKESVVKPEMNEEKAQSKSNAVVQEEKTSSKVEEKDESLKIENITTDTKEQDVSKSANSEESAKAITNDPDSKVDQIVTEKKEESVKKTMIITSDSEESDNEEPTPSATVVPSINDKAEKVSAQSGRDTAPPVESVAAKEVVSNEDKNSSVDKHKEPGEATPSPESIQDILIDINAEEDNSALNNTKLDDNVHATERKYSSELFESLTPPGEPSNKDDGDGQRSDNQIATEADESRGELSSVLNETSVFGPHEDLDTSKSGVHLDLGKLGAIKLSPDVVSLNGSTNNIDTMVNSEPVNADVAVDPSLAPGSDVIGGVGDNAGLVNGESTPQACSAAAATPAAIVENGTEQLSIENNNVEISSETTDAATLKEESSTVSTANSKYDQVREAEHTESSFAKYFDTENVMREERHIQQRRKYDDDDVQAYSSSKPRDSTDDLIKRILAEARGEVVPESPTSQRARPDMNGVSENGTSRTSSVDEAYERARQRAIGANSVEEHSSESLLQRRLVSMEKRVDSDEEGSEKQGASGYKYRTRRLQQTEASSSRYERSSRQRGLYGDDDDDDDDSIGYRRRLYNRAAPLPLDDDDDDVFRPSRRYETEEEYIPDEEFVPQKDEDTDERVKERSAEIRGVIGHQENVLEKLKSASDSFDELSSEIKAIKEAFLESSMRRSMILDDIEYDLQLEEEENRRRELQEGGRRGGGAGGRTSYRKYKSSFKDYAAEYEQFMSNASRYKPNEVTLDKDLEDDTIGKKGALKNLAFNTGSDRRTACFRRQAAEEEFDDDDEEDYGYRGGRYRSGRIDDADDTYTKYKKKYGSRRAASVSCLDDGGADDYDMRSQRSYGSGRAADDMDAELENGYTPRRTNRYRDDDDDDMDDERGGSGAGGYQSSFMQRLHGGGSSYGTAGRTSYASKYGVAGTDYAANTSSIAQSKSYVAKRAGVLGRSSTLPDYKFERPAWGEDATPTYRKVTYDPAPDVSSSRFLQKVRSRKAAGEDISARDKPFKSRFLGRSFDSDYSSAGSSTARASYSSTSFSSTPSDTLSAGSASPDTIKATSTAGSEDTTTTTAAAAE